MNNRLRTFALAGFLAAVWACGGDSATGTATVVSVTVTPPTVTVGPSATAQLTATPKDAQGHAVTGRLVAWTSNANSVATVSGAGVVTGGAAGTATITATVDGVASTATVMVSTATVASVTLTPGNVTVAPGATTQLTANAFDAQGAALTGRQATWSSNAVTVATVNGSGLVTAGAAGTATITATIDGHSATAVVTVAVPFIIRSLVAGSAHSCGLTASGVAFCWGDNFFGQLGDGTYIDRLTPVVVGGGHAFASLTASGFHTCGLTASGAAFCWGYDEFGQLGDGSNGDASTMSRNIPVAVGGGFVFSSLAAGGLHTCGLIGGASGPAYCWGLNFYGELGDATSIDRTLPVAVSGARAYASIVAGDLHTCALTSAGAAFCWGDNEMSELGDGTTAERHVPTGVTGGRTFASLAAAGSHTCGLLTTGPAYCWGDNSFGQLGDGTVLDRSAPTVVTGVGGNTYTKLSLGGWRSCGSTGTGATFCWGQNLYGEVGDGTTTERHTPVAVIGGLLFTAVGSGDSHSCGATSAGVTYCWGLNDHGQLGDATMINRTAPVLVRTP